MDTPRIVLKPFSLFLNPKPNNCFMDTHRIVLKPKGAVDRGRMSHDKERWKQPIFSWFLLLFLSPTISAQTWDGVVVTQVDFQALQAFKQELMDPKGFLRSWNDSGFGACSGGWSGIKCAQGQVIVIQLPWRGLAGRISDKIGQLQALRKLSLHDNLIGGQIPATMGLLPSLRGVQLFNNLLSGSVPPSLGSCPLLQTIDLSNNSLAGEVPDSLGSSEKLHWLNLSFNSLTGTVPASLTRSSSLAFLALQHNNLSGSIPDGLGKLFGLRSLDLSWNNLVGEIPVSLENLQNLTTFSVAHNNLSGAVPARLVQKFSPSAFAGNVQLCGYGVSAPCPTQAPSQGVHAPPGEEPKLRRHRRLLSTKDIILIAAGVLILLVLVLCCALLFCLLRRRNGHGDGEAPGGGGGRVEKGRESGAEEAESGGKLVHFDGQMAFTADDLLCATAEIMGKSTYGTVYRATLEGGGQVAVKRLREKMSKGQSEFENEVNYLGRIRHPNLLPMRAYYLGPKGEKLLVFDYLPNGSLAAFLHARETDNTPIDWDTRKNIARGVARGLFHLHAHESIIHGNLTSSNVLINDDSSAKISDFGLSRLMTAAANSNVIATAGALGYRAPELSKLKNANAKSDVYSLGVIMLELLTGKSPGEAINGLDLPRWVASVVKEEWTNEVFDVELMSDVNANIGDELLNVLKLGLHCVDPSPTVRPELEQVLRQLEDIRPEMSTSSGDDAAVGPSASH